MFGSLPALVTGAIMGQQKFLERSTPYYVFIACITGALCSIGLLSIHEKK